MVIKSSSFVPGRRQFLTKILPAGALFCFGGGHLFTLTQAEQKDQAPAEKHKFLADSKMSFKEVFDFAFRNSFILIMRNLENEMGKEKFIEMLKRVSSEAATQNIQNMAKNLPERTLAMYMTPLKKPNYFWKHVLTYEFVEDTETAVEGKVTECLWAKTFREAKAGDIGYAAICYPDFAMAKAFSPKMRLIRTKTLMQGDEFCNHRYIWEA